MDKAPFFIKKKLLFFFFLVEILIFLLLIRVFYLQAFQADTLQAKAYEQHTRDRLISPKRGSVFDRNMNGIAVTESVYSVSVIRVQIEDAEKTAQTLSEILDMDYTLVLEKCKKRVALERIKAKVDKEKADEIRKLNMPGVIVDDDVKRIYPYSSLAAQVIGFVGKDNQGIVGLEAKYDSYLKGEVGKILTETDARGIQIDDGIVDRIDPTPGQNLVTSIDIIMQQYAEQTIHKAVVAKQAKRGLIILMNPQNGEIYAMANDPTFDLNDPFTINSAEFSAMWESFSNEEQMNYLNQMWRNFAINDTYEPGSSFKIVTSSAGLESGVITTESTFSCSGYRTVGGRQIKCWRSPRSHGALDFYGGVQNSCNPVFMEIAELMGAEMFYSYLMQYGLDKKTGIDLPGEAVGIFHKLENIGSVELATMSFGQSFQITPLQLLRAASASINGGYLITPHIATQLIDDDGVITHEFEYDKGEKIISDATSAIMRDVLASVVEVGTGNKTYLPGYRIGGKTATSEKLPRRNGKYIASFLAFAPAEDPQLIALVLIDEPQGAYYGGQVAGPVMKELLQNVLPYLNIEPLYNENEQAMPEVMQISMPDLTGQTEAVAKKTLTTLGLKYSLEGDGETITGQFPKPGELVNPGAVVILRMANEQ